MRGSPPARLGRPPAESEVGRLVEYAGRRFSVAGGTRVGHRYPANYDVLHVDPVFPFVAVADGLGDGPGSALAASIAVEALVEAVRGTGRDLGAGRELGAGRVLGPELLRAAVAKAQARVRAAGAELAGPAGATLTALVADPGGTTGWLAQLGDSRAYRFRDGMLELLTTDHNRAWLHAVHGGHPAGPPSAVARYQLTRYVGHPADPDPDLLHVTLRPGDVYCVCTDGVSELLEPARLARRLGTAADPVKVAHTLLSDAMAAGGRDNATLAVVRVEPR